MQRVLVVVGPTAVGKTSFGIKCANAFNGEIISGDSIQIYKGLDIGSAKPNLDEQNSAKHYLIDIKEATDNYSVKDFQDLGRSYINKISNDNKLPIVVGGTGLYIKALLYDYEFMNEDSDDNQYEELSNEEIYNRLKEVDPASLDKIHINNRKRLVRALNVYEKHKIGISEIKDNQEHKPIYDCLIIGLTKDRQELYSLIDKRVDKMINDGLLDEIKRLLDKGITFDNQCMQAIGYKEFKDYFNNTKSLQDCINDVKVNSRHFAKRQYTFFNNQLNVKWFDNADDALNEVKQWLI